MLEQWEEHQPPIRSSTYFGVAVLSAPGILACARSREDLRALTTSPAAVDVLPSRVVAVPRRHQPPTGVLSDIAFYAPYAQPFSSWLVLAGEIAAIDALSGDSGGS